MWFVVVLCCCRHPRRFLYRCAEFGGGRLQSRWRKWVFVRLFKLNFHRGPCRLASFSPFDGHLGVVLAAADLGWDQFNQPTAGVVWPALLSGPALQNKWHGAVTVINSPPGNADATGAHGLSLRSVRLLCSVRIHAKTRVSPPPPTVAHSAKTACLILVSQ